MLITIGQVAEILDLSESGARKWLSREKICKTRPDVKSNSQYDLIQVLKVRYTYMWKAKLLNLLDVKESDIAS